MEICKSFLVVFVVNRKSKFSYRAFSGLSRLGLESKKKMLFSIG